MVDVSEPSFAAPDWNDSSQVERPEGSSLGYKVVWGHTFHDTFDTSCSVSVYHTRTVLEQKKKKTISRF